MNPEKKNQTER